MAAALRDCPAAVADYQSACEASCVDWAASIPPRCDGQLATLWPCRLDSLVVVCGDAGPESEDSDFERWCGDLANELMACWYE
jgi:hypothetical protein